MEYVSPFDERAQEPAPLAQRPPSLDGRTVALLDITKNRGAEFLDRIEHHLRERGAEVERYRKPLFSRPAAGELVERIAARAELAVEGLAD